ncbi:MAG: penicillin-binding protein 2 [Bacteroidota bacterium]|nr:penicillin-binding protein 2 [Bacteroidota bacterium]MDP4214890.1 penicillin-binding protein 2 [Bacteroidota bacterium]MDP4247358.1 penicillin-binding protein 2 [Bacteroidota bacterium]MDP4252388.1 penicillin-binding protein 2 [Bacteroidota bacterium]MDP4257945.1 penicillin-binding protein 2 [Bacteroidota bacterium]
MSVFNQSRSNIIRLIFAGMFLVIAAQLFHLQIISGKYKKLAEENALFRKSIYPTRGIIYDRKGRSILNNTIMYDLMITPSQVRNIDTAYFCQLLGIDTAEFRSRILDARFKNGPFRPSIFEDLLPPDMYARLEENIWKFPGFNLQERPVRTYPFDAAAHIMGYVGEVDSAILKRSNNFYQLGDYVGRSGLEQSYERELMGQRGIEFWLKDNRNRLVDHYQNKALDTPAVAGKNLRTYMDIELQQLAERLLAGKVGAIVAIEPRTGGILAMASGPGYNPNSLTGPAKQENYGRLALDVSGPLLNRAIKGQYQPGSTYKPLGALIGLDEGVISPASGYPCLGLYTGCARPVKCDEHKPGHAANLRLAIANSCNSFFINAFRLEVDNSEFHSSRAGLMKWKEYVNAFGLGHRIGVDLPSEDAGNIPDTAVYDKEYHRSWNSCTMYTMGIGQDKMTVTPLQMANTMCIVANKGYFYTPHFVEKIDGAGEDDTILNRFRQRHEVLTHIPDANYEVVQSGMQDVVEIGTGRPARIPGIDMCGKTGTAENYRIFEGKRIKLRNNAVFVCFAPRDNPRIAVAVVVENVGYGGTYAAPIASLIVEKYLNDTLRAESREKVESIASSDLMPTYLVRAQFLADSIRAATWALQTGDSTRLQKYTNRASRAALLDTMHKIHTFIPVQPKMPADKPKQTPTPKPELPVKGAGDSTR